MQFFRFLWVLFIYVSVTSVMSLAADVYDLSRFRPDPQNLRVEEIRRLYTKELWREPNAPFDAFKVFAYVTEHTAKQWSDVALFFPESQVSQSKDDFGKVSVHVDAPMSLDTFINDVTGMDIMYYDVKRRGKLAILTLEGIDLSKNLPARWEVHMIEEQPRAKNTTVRKQESPWKFKDLKVVRDETYIQESMRDWTIGKDNVQVVAIYKGVKDDQIELLLNTMQVIYVPFAELSDADVAYLAQMKQSQAQKLAEHRAGLLAKSKAQKLIFFR